MDFTCKLNTETTEVTFHDSLKNLLNVPAEYADSTLYVFDTFTESLFADLPDKRVVIPRGEQEKNIDTVQKILNTAVELGLGRDALFMAIGGGVVCDITAFAASIYMRGIDVILLPTTLLAMVDASLGGKTGVDFHDYKNMVGTFHPAAEVRIYPGFIKTLSEHEFLNGLAEIIKHALLTGGTLFHDLQQEKTRVLARDEKLFIKIIHESLLVKKSYIEQDPKETKGLRALLNFGHTFGHALESILGLGKFSHGAAVVWGIHKALTAGVKMGFTDKNYLSEVESLFMEYGYNLSAEITEFTSFKTALLHDKKNRAGKVRFIMQKKLAETEIMEIPDSILAEILELQVTTHT